MDTARTRYFVGIDPGKTGAAAFFSEDGTFIDVVDFSDVFVVLAQRRADIILAYLEEVHSMPKQGVVSTFNFGMNYGWWQGVLTGLGIPYITIRPQEWQKGLVPKKENKSDKPSLEVARSMFPDAPLSRKKDHNRADAILIGHTAYMREVVQKPIKLRKRKTE